MTTTEPIERREFLAIATWSIGGVISVLIGVPAQAYIVGPALSKKGDSAWVPLGSIHKVELGTPTLFKINLKHQTGWIVDEEIHSVNVLTDNGRDFIAMSNVFTHLGYRVRWIADRKQFYCPCHVGVFDWQGLVVSGSPPRPLDRYELIVEGDQIFIGQLFGVKS